MIIFYISLGACLLLRVEGRGGLFVGDLHLPYVPHII